jgi:hypothetical protein
MCPICIATAAWIAAGATSTGGISALVVRRFRGNQEQTMNHEPGESNGQQQEPNQHE